MNTQTQLSFVAGAAFFAAVLFACTPMKHEARDALHVIDRGCLVFRESENAVEQVLCDFEHEILPFMDKLLASRGNVSVRRTATVPPTCECSPCLAPRHDSAAASAASAVPPPPPAASSAPSAASPAPSASASKKRPK